MWVSYKLVDVRNVHFRKNVKCFGQSECPGDPYGPRHLIYRNTLQLTTVTTMTATYGQ